MLAAVLAGCQDRDQGAVYSVKDYNSSSDPAQDLAATVREAEAAKKRVLLQVGGQWCGWCHMLDQFIAENERVAAALRDHFIIMKVNVSDENRNEAFLAQYPDVPGYPHLFVLDSDGTLLHSQSTAELEEGNWYNEAAILAFLDRWKR
jgi:thioredoxin-related protein